jgi:hypothetical protein
VADLTSWARQQQSLAAWLTEEVAVRQYKIPSGSFSYWFARNKIVLLLDGLDEVELSQRDACAAAINAFRHEHGLIGIAVCCLTSEAEKLTTRLELEEAIELESPTDTQVDSYLRHVEEAGIPVDDIRTAIAADDGLRDLLRAPLMLHVVTRACQGLPGTILQPNASTDARLHRLWDEYVNSMFQRRPVKGRGQYTQPEDVSWLEWLADALRSRSETEFYLDRLGVEWLPPQTRRHWRFVEYLSHVLAEYIRPVEEIHWSWAKLKSRFYIGPLAKGAPVTMISAIITMIPAYLGVLAVIGYSSTAAASRDVSFVLSGTALGLSCVAIVFLSLGWTTELRDARTTPNEGIRRSARNGLMVGFPAAALLGLIFGLADEYIFKLPNAFVFGLIAGLIAGLFIGLVFGFGACLAHYLVRLLLVRAGAVPWRYRQFLEAMTDRQLLRRSGGCYLFAHRLLRDHLADRVAQRTSPS